MTLNQQRFQKRVNVVSLTLWTKTSTNSWTVCGKMSKTRRERADKGKSSSDEENDLLCDDEICDIVLTQRSRSRSAAISEDEERLGQNLPLLSGDESENLDHSETTREKRDSIK